MGLSLADQLLAFYKANITGPNLALYKPVTLEDHERAWLIQNGGTPSNGAGTIRSNQDMQVQLGLRVTEPLRPVGFVYS